MGGERVVATDAAKSAAIRLAQTVGRLTPAIEHLRQLGQRLSSPAVWDGPVASVFRTSQWPPAERAMEAQLRSLHELGGSADRIIKHILAAGKEGAIGEPRTAPRSNHGFLGQTWNFMKDFGEGLWGGIVSTVKFAWFMQPISFVTDPIGHIRYGMAMAELGHSLLTSPGAWVQLGKSMIDWDDWVNGHPGRAVGQLTPTIVLTVLTWGAGGAASGAGRAAVSGAERAVASGAERAVVSGAERTALQQLGKDLGNELTQSKWAQATIDERRQLASSANQTISTRYGFGSHELKFGNLGGSHGQYVDAWHAHLYPPGTKFPFVEVDENLLRTESPSNLIETLAHENRHRYQFEAVKGNINVNPELRAAWKDAIDNYPKQSDFADMADYYKAYRGNAIEADAWDVGKLVADSWKGDGWLWRITHGVK